MICVGSKIFSLLYVHGNVALNIILYDWWLYIYVDGCIKVWENWLYENLDISMNCMFMKDYWIYEHIDALFFGSIYQDLSI
jgi:hypothetical protein